MIEESIVSLLQQEDGYEFIDENYPWFQNRELDEFINKDLLEDCLKKIKPDCELRNIKEAIKTIERIDNPSLFKRNYQFHRYLVGGITVEDRDLPVNPIFRLIDFEHPENNAFQVCRQVKFHEGHDTRIPDVIVSINGLPLISMELKAFDEEGIEATLLHAYAQLGGSSERDGYRFDIPTLFNYNAFW